MTPQEYKKQFEKDFLTQKGFIQFYKPNEGYGFVVSESGETYYFSIHRFKDKDIPQTGRYVCFIPSKKPVARGKKPNIESLWYDIEKQGQTKLPKSDKEDSRVRCPHCGKLVMPRMSFYQGAPDASYCPLCGGLIKEFRSGFCFIATAAYGDRMAEEVIALRRFRNECLLPHAWGRLLVKVYYAVSPWLAEHLKHYPTVCGWVRKALDPLARKFGAQ